MAVIVKDGLPIVIKSGDSRDVALGNINETRALMHVLNLAIANSGKRIWP
jgi:hypothetical protein